MNTTRASSAQAGPGHATSRFQILALSGGGYRGLYTARVLELLKQQIEGRKLYVESVSFSVMTTDCARNASLFPLSSQTIESGGVQPLR